MKKVAVVLIGVLLATIVAGLGILLYINQAHDSFEADATIKVSADGAPQKIKAVSLGDIKPGDTIENTIELYCLASGTYLVTISFDYTGEQEISDSIANLISVSSEVNNIRQEDSLYNLLSGNDTLSVNCTLESDVSTPIYINYHMSEEVGNEAQGVFADFNIVIDISKA